MPRLVLVVVTVRCCACVVAEAVYIHSAISYDKRNHAAHSTSPSKYCPPQQTSSSRRCRGGGERDEMKWQSCMSETSNMGVTLLLMR